MNRVNSCSCSALLRWQHRKRRRSYYYYYHCKFTATIQCKDDPVLLEYWPAQLSVNTGLHQLDSANVKLWRNGMVDAWQGDRCNLAHLGSKVCKMYNFIEDL